MYNNDCGTAVYCECGVLRRFLTLGTSTVDTSRIATCPLVIFISCKLKVNAQVRSLVRNSDSVHDGLSSFVQSRLPLRGEEKREFCPVCIF